MENQNQISIKEVPTAKLKEIVYDLNFELTFLQQQTQHKLKMIHDELNLRFEEEMKRQQEASKLIDGKAELVK